MTTVLIVVHLMVILAMIGLVLLQRSEGGALGIGGGQGAFMTGRGAGNVLTRATGILAIAFFATSLGLALLAKYESRPSDILESLPAQTSPPDAPAETPGGQITPEDLLREFGGGTSGPQQPPAADGTTDAPAQNASPAETAPVAPEPSAPSAPATSEPQPPPAPDSGQN